MQYVKLPYSDLEVSRIAFGAWPIAGGFNWGPQDEKDSRDTLRAAYEQGINFFDTAPGYGHGKSEELISKELGDIRDKICIATKAAPKDFKYDLLKQACETRLKALKTDFIDLFQLHWPNWDIPLEETLRALQDLKKEGKIRAYGVSNFGKKDLSDFVNLGAQVTSNQLPYSLIWRAIEFEILPECIKQEVPVLCYMPIMQGLLAGKFENADEVPEDRARTRHFSKDRNQTRHNEEGLEEETFATLNDVKAISKEIDMSMANLSMLWLLNQPGVSSIIVGARNPDQVNRNLEILKLSLPTDILQKLSDLTDPLKEKLGRNPDMWQDEAESRFR